MRRPASKFRYRRALRARGEAVLLRRYTGSGTNRPRFDVEVRARVIGYQPTELIGSITQGDRRVIILLEDAIKAQFALPITTNDKCVVRGRELAIMAADDNTHRDGTECVAYELQVRG
jgi:hypothetical protein